MFRHACASLKVMATATNIRHAVNSRLSRYSGRVRTVHSRCWPQPCASATFATTGPPMTFSPNRTADSMRAQVVLCSVSTDSRMCVMNMSSSSASGITEKELKKEMDDLTDQFMETRELLADAMEAKGTVYFNDDLEEAKESVQETLGRYQNLLHKLNEEQERNVRRTIGLKMEELRAQEAMIIESLADD